ncbi:MAG: NAD(P)/FAD-dependent oxidoreductase [Eubacteriales bacterium]|nr:NAD(P)/FAD-dependent oxidoreductase [Eubacteriales bacterium]
MERYDIAIIGTGPAGLSAAVTATIRKKKILLIGSASSSDKVSKAHSIQNYLGLPAVSGGDLQKAFLDHITSMDISITEDRVTLIYPMGEYFAIQAVNGSYEASSVIIASGVTNGKPYPNEEEYLGRGVSYCATCDAPLYKGASVGIVGFSPKEEAEVEFMAEYASQVTYFPMYKEEVHLPSEIRIIRETPKAILAEGFKASGLETDQNSYAFDGVFLLRESVSPKQLVPGLEMDGNHIKVQRDLSTNTPGCFACGDITGTPYQYIKSAGEGNVAALSAAAYLDNKRRNANNSQEVTDHVN